jgi:glutamine cyclotransferase
VIEAASDDRSLEAMTIRLRASVLLLILVPAVTAAGIAALPGAGDALSSDGLAAPVAEYRVVKEYPHDPDAFTQGLVYVDDDLFEGTGQNGQSSLRRVDLETGDVLQLHQLSPLHFGEGITVLGDRIFQITWQTETCFVYDMESFDQIGTFQYDGEGWGLTTDGQLLIMSDGSNRVVYRDPETFEIVRSIEVFDGDEVIASLNELEYIDGQIWANVWLTDYVARIDSESGAVVEWLDLTGLLSPEITEEYDVDVLNGIAYDEETDRIFVTGKYWPTLFEIEVEQDGA